MKRIERKATKEMSKIYRYLSLTAKDRVKMLKIASVLKRGVVIAAIMNELDSNSPLMTVNSSQIHL